ncbi:MAG: alkaline phosphatase family protein [Angustibacter sp.]
MRLVGRVRAVAALAAVAVLAAACGGSARPSASGTSRSAAPVVPPTSAASTSPAGATGSAPSPRTAAAVAPQVSKLLVVVLENHNRSQALSRMPGLAAQARRYGQATQWYAVAHPSLPNYLELTGGSTFAVRDDRPPSSHRLASTSVFGQLLAAHHSVRAYVESMPTTCAQANSGRYAVRHNAWAYFASAPERAACNRYDVPAGTTSSGALHDDVVAGRLPTYAQLVPDVCHDGHDCSLATADAWLGAWLARIEAGPDFTTGRLAVVVTFDEDDHFASNHVAFVVAAAQLHGRTVSTRFTHASLAAAPSRLVGLTPLRSAAASPDVLRAFGLR